jgi:NAD(P)-dependent dehydrogenase (short-subunit alcohol dehydrogenase family)
MWLSLRPGIRVSIHGNHFRSGDLTMNHVVAFVLMVVASVNTAMAADIASAPAPNAQKAVLVTGASTGIGRKITERLTKEGYFVYAGARKEQDLRDLNAIPNVHSLRLDVTSADDIAAAVDTVTRAGRGLYALVNNAGVGLGGPLTETKEEDFHFLMNVNCYGPYRVTKAFSPLIVASKGRITTIGSISGILAGPNSGAYSMSKHAIEAFSDVLAAEMAPLGVQVSVVEPGNYNSEISKAAATRAGAPWLGDRSRYKEPDEVAAVVLQALSEPNPKRRYMITPNQREAEITIRKAIEVLVQLNEGQQYTYDRDALVKMLDESLATAKPKTSAPIVATPTTKTSK